MLQIVLCFGLFGMSGLIVFFANSMVGRSGGQTIPFYIGTTGVIADEDNLLIAFLPDSSKGVGSMFISYLTQGYYALSMALDEPFVPCYGIGNSYFFTGLSRRFLGPTTISDRTYPARLETYGWDRFGKWHTFYTWVASDVSFPGVLLVMVLVGRLFAPGRGRFRTPVRRSRGRGRRTRDADH